MILLFTIFSILISLYLTHLDAKKYGYIEAMWLFVSLIPFIGLMVMLIIHISNESEDWYNK